jgi:P4 family phage/plasmid primase-like protien
MHENAKVGPNTALYKHGLIEAISRWDGKYDMTVAEAAVTYAQCGVRVFPCHPETKAPLVPTGFKAATADVSQVRKWWARWPDAMIGVPTGSASGFWVLDVDDIELFDAGCQINLPETLCSITGRGQHVFFRWDARNPVRNAQKTMSNGEACWPFSELPGCDARGEGGYVIVPPSRHPNGNLYRWKDILPPAPASEELYACVTGRACSDASPGTREARKRRAPENDTRSYEEILSEACEQIRGAQDGTQEETLRSVCLRVGALIETVNMPYAMACERLLKAACEMPSYNDDNPWKPAALGKKVTRAIEDGMKKAQQRKKSKRAAKPSEDQCAREFVRRFADIYRYECNNQRWIRWSGHHWASDEGNRVAYDIRKLVREMSGDDPTCCRSSFITGVLKLASSDPAVVIARTDLDPDHYLLGTPEGTVDLRSGTRRDANPADLITMVTSVGPQDGKPERWLTFLDQITNGDRELQKYLQILIGYCLTGSTKEQSLFFLHGIGGNGKSVFLGVIQKILGDYAQTAAIQTFMASRYPQHTTNLAALAGARLVTATETEAHTSWDESLIKQITGGEQMTARFMRQDNFSFTPSCKLIVAGNYPPTLNNVDPATRRRFKIIPFKFAPPQIDKDLTDKLLAEQGQILSWAIEGCLMWQRHGLAMPEAVSEATDEFFDTQDPFGDWFSQKCERASADTATKASELWLSWQDYAKTVGEDPKTQKLMSQKLKSKGFTSRRGAAGYRIYPGIKLK